MPFSEAVLINPDCSIKQGTIYPFVDMQAISPGIRDVKCSEHREFTGGGSRFENRDTLMARITPCLENGKIARYKAADGERIAHGSTEFIVIRGRPDVTENDYAYYLTISPDVRAFAISQMTGTSGRQRVPTDSLTGISVQIPSIPEQMVIAQILGSLDDKIELNRRMNKTLEAMARAIFKSWFVEAIEKELPKGWHEGKAGEILRISRGSIDPREFPEETFDHYSIPAFDEGNFPKREIGGKIQSNKFVVFEESVLLSKLNPRIPRIWIPKVAKTHRSICSTEFIVAIPNPGITREYLYDLFRSEQFLDRFVTLVTGTSGSHQRVKPEDLLVMDINIPSTVRIGEYTRLVKPLHEKIALNLDESHSLAEIRDILLPKLMSGEIRVDNV